MREALLASDLATRDWGLSTPHWDSEEINILNHLLSVFNIDAVMHSDELHEQNL